MGGKVAIATGLLAGIAVGGIALGGLLLLTPGPVDPPAAGATAAASPAPASVEPSVAVSPSTGPSDVPSIGPSTSPSAGASGSPAPPASVVPSGSGGETGFGVGEPAPALAVGQLGGGDIDLANLRGKPVWVNFMASWCPSCRDELPIMAGYAARYEETGLVVLVIDIREDETTVDAFMKSLGVTFPVGLDSDGAAQTAWGAYALPVHFWVDADGVVRDGALGGIGPDVMAAGLRTILPGVDVTLP